MVVDPIVWLTRMGHALPPDIKALRPKKGPPMDYDEIRAKVSRAAELMAHGMLEVKAAKKVSLPRSSLQQYLKHGVPKSSLPGVKKLPRGLGRAKPAC